MVEKHNGNIFETSESSIVVFSIALVNLIAFYKIAYGSHVFNQFCPKPIGFLL